MEEGMGEWMGGVRVNKLLTNGCMGEEMGVRVNEGMYGKRNV